jgi:ADP-ribose pyrophosphatase
MLAPKTIAAGNHLSLVSRANWEYVEFCTSRGIVSIAAITDADELILVEQVRVPVDLPVIELPAGLLELSDIETPAEAAKRELYEETGYTATDVTLLMMSPLSAGLTGQPLFLFLARGLELQDRIELPAVEDIQVHRVKRSEVAKWLLSLDTRSVLVDSKIFAAMYLIDRVLVSK